MIPEAFQPRTDEAGEHFTIRQRRTWTPWILGGMSAGALLFAVGLINDIPAGSLWFVPLAVARAYAAVRFYRGEVTEIGMTRSGTELRWGESAVPLSELTKVEVLGDELPQLMVRYGDGRSSIVPAQAHSIEEARALAAELSP